MSGIPAGAGQLLGKRLGKYEIVALLALGGTAEIYLARIDGASGFEKYVVVKSLHDHLADDPEFVKMFLDEARLAAHLDHSNIVQTMELSQEEGRYYMVMEFLAGLSLAMIVRRAQERLPGGKLPAALVLNVLAQAASGLHYAHDKAMNGKQLNIVHRDISPQNLVISFEGVVKVVDFGIAKAEMRETHTRSGTIKGKFAYMSPEQCVANNVDRRTDVFALGVIGHELLTGRRLFKRASPYETYQAVLECDVKPPSVVEPGLDPGIDAVIMRAITKDKESRYPTTEAFGDALLGYLHHRGISSGPNDVSRFFDAHFAQEIDEHAARMRELISGREIAVDTGWGEDEEKEELVAAPAKAESGGSMSMLLDGLDLGDLGGGGGDDDDMPAERTRIEANPLDQINELEKMISAAREASQKSPVTPDEMPSIGAGKDAQVVSLAEPAKPEAAPAAKRGLPSFSRASTAPETQPMAPSSMRGTPPAVARTMSLQIDGPGMGAPPGMPPQAPMAMPMGMGMGMPEPDAVRAPPGRFPDAANRPTMLAIPEAEALTHAPKIPPSAQIPLTSGVIGGLPENARTQIAPLPAIPGIDSGMGDGAPPIGYPVMSAEMRSQIEIGATVFPGAPHAHQPQPQPHAPQPHAPQPQQMGMPGMHGHGGSQMGMPNMYGQPQMGSGMYVQPPMGPQMGSGMYVQPPMADPQRAANMMSPVGPQYGNRVDWTAAASAKIRVMPPWLLAILFIAALGLALTLTIVIARLVA